MERSDLPGDAGDDVASIEFERDLDSGMRCKCTVVDYPNCGNVLGKGWVHEDVVSACPFKLVVGGVACCLVVSSSTYAGSSTYVNPPFRGQEVVFEEIDVFGIGVEVRANDSRWVAVFSVFVRCNLKEVGCHSKRHRRSSSTNIHHGQMQRAP